MDREVTVRFYSITSVEGVTDPFESLIDRANCTPKQSRHKSVREGITVRLESLTEKNGLLIGDLTRIQTENLPGKVTELDVEPLPFDRLGHYVGFCYDPTARVIALQFDMKLRIGAVLSYFEQFAKNGGHSYLPELDQASLEKLSRETVKSFKLKVSGIQEFSKAVQHPNDFEEAFEDMAAVFNAPTVEIVMKSRALKKLDGDGIVAQVKRLLRFVDETSSIKAIQASTEESEDAYNFMQQLLKEKEKLQLPQNDPTLGREVRMDFLERAYEKHKPNIWRNRGLD